MCTRSDILYLLDTVLLYCFSVGGVSHRSKMQSLPLCLFVIFFTSICFIVGIFMFWKNGTDIENSTEKISNQEDQLSSTNIYGKIPTTR